MTLPTSAATVRRWSPRADDRQGPAGDGTFVLPGRVTVAAPVVVRVAGLPMTAILRLPGEQSFREACAIVRLREWLGLEGRALSDDLYGAVGARPPGADRVALVGLRRSVYQVRRPAPREWNDDVVRLLPADVATRLHTWTASLDFHDRLSAGLPATVERDAVAGRAALRDVVRDPGFQRALSLSSPTLYAQTAKWLADESRVPRRAVLVRLAAYAGRAATKTSPYSAFTLSGWATWSRRGRDIRLDAPAAAVGVTELSGHLLAGLRRAVQDDPCLSAALPLRLNPSATRVGDTVRFLGPPPGEPIVAVPATPAVLACLQILGAGDAHPRSVLRDLLGATDLSAEPLADLSADSGAAVAVDSGAARAVDRLLDRLLDAGLLERRLDGGDRSADPLDELSGWLAIHGAPDRARAVRQVRSRLRHSAPVGDLRSQLAAQRALGVAVDDLAACTGVGVPPGVRSDRWYQNAVLPESIGELSSIAWRPALTDLDLVRRMLAALDPALPRRVVLGAYCGERFGPGARVPFLTLHESIARDLAADTDEILRLFRTTEPVPDTSLDTSRLPRLRAVARIRRDLWHAALTAPDADGVIRPDPDTLDELTASWPSWVTAPRSIACHLQAVHADGLALVLNAAHGGHGRGRTLHLIRAAGGSLPPEDTGRSPDAGPAVAEVGGLFDGSTAVRLPAAPYEIDYPFTVSGRPPGQRIPLRDLTVLHHPGTGTVSLHAAGRHWPITAQHLGMTATTRLPPAARLLVQAFGSGDLVVAGRPMFAAPWSTPVPCGVHHQHRVEVGRIVVRRARWTVAAGQVPIHAKGESDAAYLVRLAGWLLAHRIPTRCFVRINAAVRTTQPVYVDFANRYLVQVFERMTAADPTVIFEEALPAPEEAPRPAGGPARATGFVVDLTASGVADV